MVQFQSPVILSEAKDLMHFAGSTSAQQVAYVVRFTILGKKEPVR